MRDNFQSLLTSSRKLMVGSRRPYPFKCIIRPRSAASLKLIRDVDAMAD